MKKLEFMLIGAQKSGTTALASFLAEHPGLCMSQRKEAHVFDYLDLHGLHSNASLDEYYQGFFKGCDPRMAWGEATPVYLYMAGIAEKIHSYNRTPFWLALLMEPVRLWREGPTENVAIVVVDSTRAS